MVVWGYTALLLSCLTFLCSSRFPSSISLVLGEGTSGAEGIGEVGGKTYAIVSGEGSLSTKESPGELMPMP